MKENLMKKQISSLNYENSCLKAEKEQMQKEKKILIKEVWFKWKLGLREDGRADF